MEAISALVVKTVCHYFLGLVAEMELMGVKQGKEETVSVEILSWAEVWPEYEAEASIFRVVVAGRRELP